MNFIWIVGLFFEGGDGGVKNQMKMVIKFYENKKFLKCDKRFAQPFKTYNKVTIIKGYGINMRKDEEIQIYKNSMSVKATVSITKGKNI